MKVLFKNNNIRYILVKDANGYSDHTILKGIPENIVFSCYYITGGIFRLENNTYIIYTSINDIPEKYKKYFIDRFVPISNTIHSLYCTSLTRIK